MTSYNITCAGMGISFISDTLVRHVTPHPDVIYYKLPEKKPEETFIFTGKTAPWRNKHCSRTMEEF